MRAWIKGLVAAATLALHTAPAAAQAPDVTVFAAASLKNAVDIITSDYQRETGKRIAVSYAASSALAKQIEQGAPADLFISADLDWMDDLQRKNLIKPESRRSILGNRIVLVAPADRAQALDLKPGALAAALGGGRFATAAVATVPAGKYGKAALEHLGLWGEVSGKLAEAENVRAALLFVSRGEAPLGLVYETDARADPKVKVVARFPETSHPPIVYPVALTAASKSEEAPRFLTALRSPKSTEIFTREGFTPLD
ncbi:MAG TPA: molybdate ABC transporter substrate-binding protein [Microvirga sp.]|jgi:molybdate transport system substrate-binding protein|nr:molybdate ABC transporter substrate-binding protein [Microvirga sp.]